MVEPLLASQVWMHEVAASDGAHPATDGYEILAGCVVAAGWVVGSAERRGVALAVAVELVIFDCDGVLVDSEVISNRVLAGMLTEQGLPTTLPQARREYQGLLLADVLVRAEAKLGRSLPSDWLAHYEAERAVAFRRELRPVTGAPETVESLLAAGLAVCVASQGKLEKTRLSLTLTGLDHLFPEHVRFSAYTVANGKPAPDLFLHAAARMGTEPANCAVVEDTPSGVRGAVAAGMQAIGYTADSDDQALRGGRGTA